ncbi:MAG: hypothetical protein ACK5DG_06635 [Chitinophagaceae bacterium]
MLVNHPLQSGKEAMGLLAPPFLSSVFFAVCGFKNGFTKKLFLSTLLLFILQCLPFGEALTKVVEAAPKEDFARYIHYAQNMIVNHTLWGGDQLHFKNEGLSYITQPGLRYVIALELLIFGKLYRFISILNILLFTSCLFLLFKTIKEQISNKTIQVLLFLLFVLSVPYAAKNILIGIPEWFTVSLLMASVYFYFSRNTKWLTIVLLALVPFMRQNILPAVLLLLVFYIMNQKNKWRYLVLFTFVLLLPVYHNLYYAGEFRFFTSMFKWPFLTYESWHSRVPTGFYPERIANNAFHYLGFDWLRFHKPILIEEAFLFFWIFCFLFFYFGRLLQYRFLRLLYFATSLFLIIIPQLFLATDYYPRFEFVNVYLVIIVFLFLYQFKQNGMVRLPDFWKSLFTGKARSLTHTH